MKIWQISLNCLWHYSMTITLDPKQIVSFEELLMISVDKEELKNGCFYCH
jgi:hypothetical protein